LSVNLCSSVRVRGHASHTYKIRKDSFVCFNHCPPDLLRHIQLLTWMG
jgi:hypothetical protein